MRPMSVLICDGKCAMRFPESFDRVHYMQVYNGIGGMETTC